MNPNYQQEPGYAHYKSAQFQRELEFSVRIFHTVVYGWFFRYPRPIGPPNTPAELSDDESEYDSDDGYVGICGPDDDYYISMADGALVSGNWPFLNHIRMHGYWPEGYLGLGVNIGYSPPRRYK